MPKSPVEHLLKVVIFSILNITILRGALSSLRGAVISTTLANPSQWVTHGDYAYYTLRRGYRPISIFQPHHTEYILRGVLSSLRGVVISNTLQSPVTLAPLTCHYSTQVRVLVRTRRRRRRRRRRTSTNPAPAILNWLVYSWVKSAVIIIPTSYPEELSDVVRARRRRRTSTNPTPAILAG